MGGGATRCRERELTVAQLVADGEVGGGLQVGGGGEVGAEGDKLLLRGGLLGIQVGKYLVGIEMGNFWNVGDGKRLCAGFGGIWQ